MYILVGDDVELGFALVAVAHASLAAYLRFRDHPDVAAWLAGPFKKVICKVNVAEWDGAKGAAEDHVVITESALDGREVALAFRPRAEWPKRFQFLRMFR
jgi:hypothetical protein